MPTRQNSTVPSKLTVNKDPKEVPIMINGNYYVYNWASTKKGPFFGPKYPAQSPSPVFSLIDNCT